MESTSNLSSTTPATTFHVCSYYYYYCSTSFSYSQIIGQNGHLSISPKRCSKMPLFRNSIFKKSSFNEKLNLMKIKKCEKFNMELNFHVFFFFFLSLISHNLIFFHENFDFQEIEFKIRAFCQIVLEHGHFTGKFWRKGQMPILAQIILSCFSIAQSLVFNKFNLFSNNFSSSFS